MKPSCERSSARRTSKRVISWSYARPSLRRPVRPPSMSLIAASMVFNFTRSSENCIVTTCKVFSSSKLFSRSRAPQPLSWVICSLIVSISWLRRMIRLCKLAVSRCTSPSTRSTDSRRCFFSANSKRTSANASRFWSRTSRACAIAASRSVPFWRSSNKLFSAATSSCFEDSSFCTESPCFASRRSSSSWLLW